MQILKPPTNLTVLNIQRARFKIFLAGSIEMGAAVDWQTDLPKTLGEKITPAVSDEIIILNPRRDNWDRSLEQSINNLQFTEQVTWELEAMERSNLIVMYFDPATKSPITLLELGLNAGVNPDKLLVYCPKGYWRKGNVDVVCSCYGVRQVQSMEQFVGAIAGEINRYGRAVQVISETTSQA